MSTPTPLPISSGLESLGRRSEPLAWYEQFVPVRFSWIKHEARETLHLAIPIAVAQVALMVMGLVDQAFVGRISEVELAAVSMGNVLFFTVLTPAMGITLAVEPLASQAIGAGETHKAWSSVRAGIWAVAMISPLFMALCVASTYVLEPVGVDPRVIPIAREFVWARLPGIPLFLMFMGTKAYLEACGNTRPIMLGAWLANVLNFVLAGLFVLGDDALAAVGLPALGLPKLGAVGAGVVTSLSSGVMLLIALFSAWNLRPKGARLWPENMAEHNLAVKKSMQVGLPIGFQILTEASVIGASSVLIGRLGATTAAASQITLALCSFTFMAVIGMGAATAVRVGRGIGAKEPDSVRRAGIVGVSLTSVYTLGCALVFAFFGRPLASIFSTNQDVIEIAAKLLFIAAVFQLADGVQGVASGALRGAGDSKYASWANIACHWGVGFPIGVLLCFVFGWGAEGMWWGLSAGLMVVAVVLVIRFLRLSSKVIHAL